MWINSFFDLKISRHSVKICIVFEIYNIKSTVKNNERYNTRYRTITLYSSTHLVQCVWFVCVSISLRSLSPILYSDTETRETVERTARKMSLRLTQLLTAAPPNRTRCTGRMTNSRRVTTASISLSRINRNTIPPAPAAAAAEYVTWSNWSAVVESHPRPRRQKRRRTNVSFRTWHWTVDRSRRATLTGGRRWWGWTEPWAALQTTSRRRQSRKPLRHFRRVSAVTYGCRGHSSPPTFFLVALQ